MIHDKRRFGMGAALMAVFLAALAVVFSPIFGDGKNALDYLDGVFNSISKASAYYIPASVEKARRLEGTAFSVRIAARPLPSCRPVSPGPRRRAASSCDPPAD